MPAPSRRPRHSDQPLRPPRAILPHEIDGADLELLRQLDPWFGAKYATLPWLHYFTGARVEYSVLRKRLARLREAPNRYLGCPDEQLNSPNVDRKTLIFQLRDRGLGVLVDRGLTPAAEARVTHRANAYKHELIVDLGYHLPLRYLCDTDPALRLIDLRQLLMHPNVPAATRQARDPLVVALGSGPLRLDGLPHVIVRTGTDGSELALGIPGLQVDRSDSSAQIQRHVLRALEFVEQRHHVRHWGFDNCVIPFLFTRPAKLRHAMAFLSRQRRACAFLLFQTVPDYALLRHYPRPEHYHPAYNYMDGEPHHPDAIRIFTNPWQRVGCPDFHLNTFSERGAP